MDLAAGISPVSAAIVAELSTRRGVARLGQARQSRPGLAWRGEAGHVADAPMYDVSFVGGAVESHTWSYLFRTRGRLHQFSALPPNVQVQIPVGQGMLLVPGLPREHRFEILSQAWEHNTMPQGVTK